MVKKEDKFGEILEPKDLHKDKIIRTVRIQQVKSKNKQSFYIRIPMVVVDELDIKKGDKFVFEVNLKNKKGFFKLGGK